MDGSIGDWLISDFVFLGIHLQHWMVVVAAVAFVGILLTWMTGGFQNS